MKTTAHILADSLNPVGNRLTTFELKYPRIVHAELLTHKRFSRSTASSRAIPNGRLRQMVKDEPFLPKEWGSNQKGMQAGERLSASDEDYCQAIWLEARDSMLGYSELLAQRGAHKQLANRLLEPFQYITVLVSATEFTNWFALRCHPAAQPQIQELADAMWEAYQKSHPQLLQVGEWHRPLFDASDFVWCEHQTENDANPDLAYDVLANKISVGRCARVSYLTHHGTRDIAEDIRLHDDLMKAGHMSPFEHVAQALPGAYASGNYVGFHQYRKSLPNEEVKEFSGRQGEAA